MIFNYKLGASRDEFAKRGYVHAKNVLSDEFLSYLKTFLTKASAGETAEVTAGYIRGKKKQYLFEFPSQDAALEFRNAIAEVTGMAADKITISERHLKQYDEYAKEFPAPHKDRGASRISIGLPIHLGPKTSVCVFPNLDRSANTGESAVFMTDRERPDLEDIYKSDDVVFLREAVGDLVLFEGSSMYHERSQPAGTAIVYIKLNDSGEDPLGENIFAQAKPELVQPAE